MNSSAWHLANIQREFAKQAGRFDDPRLTLARADYLDWMLASLPLQERSRVLDVAAGTGHLSRAMAPRVNWILAVDLTTEMLLELGKQAASQNISNLSVARGLAERLPIRDAAFDLVVSRFAFHHFEHPATVLREMVRTCRPGGSVAIIDLVAPEDPVLAGSYNRYEQRRDASHSRALSRTEVLSLLQDAGLVAVSSVGREIEVNVDTWLELAKSAPRDAELIRRDLLAELDGGAKTSMYPFRRDGDLMFLQRWLIAVAHKAA